MLRDLLQVQVNYNPNFLVYLGLELPGPRSTETPNTRSRLQAFDGVGTGRISNRSSARDTQPQSRRSGVGLHERPALASRKWLEACVNAILHGGYEKAER